MAINPTSNFVKLYRTRPRRQPRTLNKDYAKQVKKYSQQVGTIMWAWNSIHGSLAECFVELVDPANINVGYAIWHAIKADTGQRGMVEAAITARMATRPRVVLKDLAWVVDVTGKVSQHRNDAVHTPMVGVITASGSIFQPNPFSGDPKRVTRLERADREAFHKALAGDLIALSFYANALAMELRSPGLHLSWPERPVLQSLGSSTKQAGRRTRRKQRPRQHQASRV